MIAAFSGHVDVVHVLIEAHAEINLQDKVCDNYKSKASVVNSHAPSILIGWLDTTASGITRRPS